MGFEDHYKGYISKLNKQKAQERTVRIEKAYKKYLDRKEKELE